MTRRAMSEHFADLPPTRIAIEAGAQSLWVSEHLSEMGHEVLVANVRELRAITESDRKHDPADAEKLARYARADPRILRPIKHRRSLAHADLVFVRSGATLVETRTRLSNTARSLVKPFGFRLPPISVSGYAKKALAQVPERLKTAIGPLLALIDEVTAQIAVFDQEITKLADAKYPETFALQQVHDRRHDGAQPRTQHHDLLPETGQLPSPILWQVTGAVRLGRNPRLPALLG